MRERHKAIVEIFGGLMLIGAIVLLCYVAETAATTPAQSKPRPFEFVDCEPGQTFAQIKVPGVVTHYVDTTHVSRIQIYEPNKAPDRYPWYVVYVQHNQRAIRVDCETFDRGVDVVEFIKRNRRPKEPN